MSRLFEDFWCFVPLLLLLVQVETFSFESDESGSSTSDNEDYVEKKKGEPFEKSPYFAIRYSTLEPDAEMLPVDHARVRSPGVDHMEIRAESRNQQVASGEFPGSAARVGDDEKKGRLKLGATKNAGFVRNEGAKKGAAPKDVPGLPDSKSSFEVK